MPQPFQGTPSLMPCGGLPKLPSCFQCHTSGEFSRRRPLSLVDGVATVPERPRGGERLRLLLGNEPPREDQVRAGRLREHPLKERAPFAQGTMTRRSRQEGMEAEVRIIEANLDQPSHAAAVLALTRDFARDPMGNGADLPDHLHTVLVERLRPCSADQRGSWSSRAGFPPVRRS